ncbi:MAG: hypothetical protein AAF799_47970 [Myxococcota bacterium]
MKRDWKKREPAWNGRRDTVFRILAATLGSLIPTTLACVLLARILPTSPEVATTVGVLLFLPLWVFAMAVVLLLPSAKRAWMWCLLASLGLGGPVLLLGGMPDVPSETTP